MSTIDLIPTGAPGLDRILGGGFPALSFNIIAGDPGAGKTTLAHQIVFANASEERPALYLTVVGEPPVKMLRYQGRFPFYDTDRVGRAVFYENLSAEAAAGDLDAALARIEGFVAEREPALVVVDSVRSVVRLTQPDEARLSHVQEFVQRLATAMSRWEATTFLVGEFLERETPLNPVFTVADGLLWLRQHREDDARVRKLEVSKLRGGAELPGRHVYRIGDAGLRVYPRLVPELEAPVDRGELPERLSTGIPRLDEIMDGGLVPGDAVVVSGPSGCGKSILGMQFLRAGLDRGERCVAALFEEGRTRYQDRADEMGIDLRQAEADGRFRLLQRQALDLSVDETFEDIRDAVEAVGASRVVIDSLSGLQVLATGAEAQRLRQAMSRVVRTLVDAGVTVLMTAELSQRMDQLRFTPHESSFLADDIVVMRYVEIRGELQSVLSVIKMRRSAHSRAFHRYGVTPGGIVVGEALSDLRGILTGVPEVGGGGERPRDTADWEEVERSGGVERGGRGGGGPEAGAGEGHEPGGGARAPEGG